LLLCMPMQGDRCASTLKTNEIVKDINDYVSKIGISQSSCVNYRDFLTSHLVDPVCP